MKTKFTINAIVAAALPKQVLQDKLTQAVEASLNSYRASKEDWKRGGLKEVKKTADAQFKETGEILYSGERNIVSSFVQWHDRVVSMANRAEKIGCVVTCAEIPPVYNDWLAKFTPKAGKAKEGAEQRNPTGAKAKGNKTPENGPAARGKPVKV